MAVGAWGAALGAIGAAIVEVAPRGTRLALGAPDAFAVPSGGAYVALLLGRDDLVAEAAARARRARVLLDAVAGVTVALVGHGGKGHRLPQRGSAYGRATRSRILAIGAASGSPALGSVITAHSFAMAILS